MTAATSSAVAPPVEVEAGVAFGLAQVMAGMFRMGSAKQPALAARMRGSLSLIGTSDDRLGATVYFERDRIRVAGSPDRAASVVVEAPLTTLSTLGKGNTATRAYMRRELKVRGLMRHPLLLHHVRRLLAAA
ncbi:MAG: SCP2 sterol-binding domain-containing protein [Solirubrobacteraceae bacterium]